MQPSLEPLSERILARVPGPRPLAFALWALVPWLNAAGNLLLDDDDRSAVWEQSDAVVALSYAALSFAVLIALWGSRRIARQLEALEPVAEKVLEGDTAGSFREVNVVAGPLLVAATAAAAFSVDALVENGLWAAALRGATWVVLGVAISTFLWTYGSLQLGLYRLGGRPIRAAAVRLDPGLGLRPLGNAAFTALWVLLAWLAPVLLTALSDVLAVAIGMLVLAAALAAFSLSLVRLHRQMVDVKAEELAFARELYAKAYAPVRASPTLEALSRQQGLLSAADRLEQRAHAIHDWPIDEGTFARVLTIATSVVGITIARLILDPFGL